MVVRQDWLALANERRQQVDVALKAALARVQQAPPSLVAAMEYGLLAPGKRVRPLLCGFACEAAGGRWNDALAAGCAVEMIHAYSLIHDDLPAMDDDDLRRGRPTVHVKFGEALAILAGDALLTLAFEVLAEAYPADVAATCCAELARAAGGCGMVGGQVNDLTWGGRIPCSYREPTLAELQEVHAAKTGALFRASVRLGYLIARGLAGREMKDASLAAFDQFAQCFGLVFQITDDLLDVEGETGEAGKRVGKDAARGKLTYPRLLGLEKSRDEVHKLIQQAKDAMRPLGKAADGLLWVIESLLGRRK